GVLAAAYLYVPWITRVMENLPGSTSAVDTGEGWMLGTGIFTDVIYMNGDFIKNRRQVALDMLKARYDAVGWWNENTEEGNQIMSDFLRWPLA
ncbi:hypothetical protein, partial [Robiginitalea biformata]|uniref:hypothetical protein n=1 Tax=Robiginitalea biformata TaxID=252307 RepID=UPI003D34BC15